MVAAIVFGICFSFGMIDVYQWHRRWPVFNSKPFNCTVCLAGWSALIGYFLPDAVLYPMLSFFAAVFIMAKTQQWD